MSDIKVDLRDVLQKSVDCKHMAHDGGQWWSLVDTVMKLGSITDRVFFSWLNSYYLLKTDSLSQYNLLRCLR
jgi:hypothetical protein